MFVAVNATKKDPSLGKGGRIKSINGVNGVPIGFMPGFPDLQDQFNQMGISDVRFHDIFGPGDVDDHFSDNNPFGIQILTSVPSAQKSRAAKLVKDFTNTRAIFPNADKGMQKNDLGLALSDANWAATDYYFKQTLDNIAALNPGHIQREVLFRIGRTNGGGNVPPASFGIYAELVAKCVERYSLKFAEAGLPRRVAYWQVWNEPDLAQFWGGSASDFYLFYETIARRVKQADPSARVGGPSIADGLLRDAKQFAEGFLQHCQKERVPLDFYAWHFYAHVAADPRDFKTCADNQRALLLKYGFGNLPNFCTEWNITPFASDKTWTKVQSYANAAYISAAFSVMNKCTIDKAYYYRADAGFLGLFNDQNNPTDASKKNFCTSAAQAFGLYKEMFGTPELLDTTLEGGSDDYHVLAGVGENAVNILLTNFKPDVSLTNPSSLPLDLSLYAQHYIDSGRSISQITDAWSLEHYFGKTTDSGALQTAKQAAAPPDNVAADNNVKNDSPAVGKEDLQVSMEKAGRVGASGEVILNISALPRDFKQLLVRRCHKDGSLTSILPASDLNGVRYSENGKAITIVDAGVTEYSITLYSIIF